MEEPRTFAEIAHPAEILQQEIGEQQRSNIYRGGRHDTARIRTLEDAIERLAAQVSELADRLAR